MNADKIVKFDRNKSEAIFTESLNDLDNLNTRDGRFEYADYVALHNDVTALYDSFSYVDEIIESLQAQLADSHRRERAAVEDLYEACRRSPCNSEICVKKNCGGNIIPCEFEWRGPVAGKGGDGMNNKTITRIPVPSEILKGGWCGTVYAIDTTSESVEAHNAVVAESVSEITSDFDNHNHYTVSLREVKRELVFADERTQHYCTLVQFRVRDSY